MKFGKIYSEFIEKKAGNQLAGCSYVEFKRLKKVLKALPYMIPPALETTLTSRYPLAALRILAALCMLQQAPHQVSRQCHALRRRKNPEKDLLLELLRVVYAHPLALSAGCDAKFFGELMEELSEVEGCFNSRAEQLVKLHMATGLRKYIMRGKRNNREAMKQEGQILINYATVNAMAVRKILKKYDKIHRSKEGGIFKSQLTAMRGELLKSPYLVELIALHLNLTDAKENTSTATKLVGEFLISFENSTPTLSCRLLESATLDFDLTCPICLETLFEPVALGCGHLFCNNCACTAVSILGHEGPRTARCDAQCAICRQAGVYLDAVKLKELSILIKKRCLEYWKDRFQREQEQQLKLKKEFYTQQMEVLSGTRKAMLGFT